MSLDDFVRRFLNSPAVADSDKQNIQALLTSHLATGLQHEAEGALQEALQEYSKEHYRPIESDIDAEIVQQSFWHVGTVYRKLGDLPNAVAAFEKALELWNRYQLGASPHGELAEIFIEQSRLDDAIALCEAWMRESHNGWAKQLLTQAQALKGG